MRCTGVSAFPLTPLRDGREDVPALEAAVGRLGEAGVDSVAVLGSTGIGAYLDRAERAAVVRCAVDVAGRTPVIAGVSALRTADVLAHAEDAAAAGAAALLLAPMTCQALTEDEVVGLFADASAAMDLPIVLYDNPGTTHVAMTPHTYGRIAAEAPVSAADRGWAVAECLARPVRPLPEAARAHAAAVARELGLD